MSTLPIAPSLSKGCPLSAYAEEEMQPFDRLGAIGFWDTELMR
jgi:hypothetical protein